MIEITIPYRKRLENAVGAAEAYLDPAAKARARELLDAMDSSGGLEETELRELLELVRLGAENQIRRAPEPKSPSGEPEDGNGEKKSSAGHSRLMQMYQQLVNSMDYLYRQQAKRAAAAQKNGRSGKR